MTANGNEAYAEALKRIDECHQKANGGTKLILAKLGLKALPPEIGQLASLTTLHLQENILSTLPPEVGSLSLLRRLYLSRNELRELPPEIRNLTLLEELFLQRNRLSTLPPEIGMLTSLTTLRLARNRLSCLPPEIDHLTGLTGLYLHQNPALLLPAKVLGPKWSGKAKPKSPKEIMNHYFGLNAIRYYNTKQPTPQISVMIDNHSINTGDITNSQVGQTLTNCTTMIQLQAPSEQKRLLEELEKQVKQLIEELPSDKKEKAPNIARNLNTFIEQTTAKEPDRDWYTVSAKGLREAAQWVQRLATPITETIVALGKLQY